MVYLCFVLWGLSSINLRGYHLIKDTVYWLIVTGILISFNSIGKDIEHFKTIVLNSIKLTIILEFLINLHVFSYVAEFVSILLIILIGILQTLNEHKIKSLRIERILNSIVMVYALSVLIFAIYRTIENYKYDFTFENLQSLLLPSILTLTFIPFAYIVCIYSAYENLFLKLYNVKNENFRKSTIKWKIIKHNMLSLTKISEMNFLLNPYYINTTKDIDQYLIDIKKTSCQHHI